MAHIFAVQRYDENLIAKLTFKNVHVMRYDETCVRYKMQVEQVMSPINVPKESFDGHMMSSYHQNLSLKDVIITCLFFSFLLIRHHPFKCHGDFGFSLGLKLFKILCKEYSNQNGDANLNHDYQYLQEMIYKSYTILGNSNINHF